MTEKNAYIKSDAGVHARPAMMLVQEATKHACDVILIKDGVEANCKSILSVLGLAITSGTTLIVRADGEGEEMAVDKLVSIINRDFKIDESEQ
ncbi:MAG: HPr family phosphocarrier protein [Spirochaetota bacterium]|nr:HPr family phosphocarrier protein [Spirochaetota bacterium]